MGELIHGHGQDLAAQLKPSFPTLAASLESDDAVPYVPAHVARRAAPLVDAAAAPAAHDELVFELGRLASVTTGDKLRSSEGIQASARVLLQAMQEYPRAAALQAIRDWPKTENGKWWPTENELRANADENGWRISRLQRHLKAALEREETRSPRRADPSPEIASFIADVSEAYGPAFVKSWLSPITCQFQGSTIWTHPIGVQRLRMRCGALLAKHRIGVDNDAQSWTYARNNTEMYDDRKPGNRGAVNTMDPRGLEPPAAAWPDSVDPEVAAKLHRLKEALASGANVGKMRRDGIL